MCVVGSANQQPKQCDLAIPFRYDHLPALSLGFSTEHRAPTSTSRGISLTDSVSTEAAAPRPWGGLSLLVADDEITMTQQLLCAELRLSPDPGPGDSLLRIDPVEHTGLYQPRPTYRPLAPRSRRAVSGRRKPYQGRKSASVAMLHLDKPTVSLCTQKEVNLVHHLASAGVCSHLCIGCW